MPTILGAHYSKRVGLPSFGAHTYSLTLRTEISDLAELDTESRRLHGLLQAAVDREIQVTGYAPDAKQPSNIVGLESHQSETADGCCPGWQCSDRQRELILTIAEERQMPLSRVEQLAQERFGRRLRQLTRPQASRIIAQMLAA